MLCHLCILRNPQTKGDKIRSGYQKRNEDCPSFLNGTGRLGPKRGRKCYITPAFSGIPQQRGTNQNWLPHHCLLGGPKEGRNATPPLHSRGYPTKGTKSNLKTNARGNNDASSISKYGGILALHAHCALLLDYVPPKEPLGTPLGNTLRIRLPKLDWRGP